MLILTPVCVKTELQRQHISKELIEYGFNEARKLGYKAVIVEGGPKNYNSRGFETSGKYGIYADKKLKEHLPKPECLMVKELYSGSLNGMPSIIKRMTEGQGSIRSGVETAPLLYCNET